MRTYVIALAFSLAFSCLGQDVKREKVKVNLSSPVSYKVSVSDVEIKEVDPVKSKVAAVFAADLAVEASYEVPSLLAVSPGYQVVAPFVNCTPTGKLVNIQTEWYDKFHAVQGSKIWWILRVAKKRAERGEDVSNLKKAFDETMEKWFLED